MNFYQRAYLSITRQKAKSLILFVVLFIMANVIAGAVAIKSASNQVAQDIKHKLGTAISIQPNIITDSDAGWSIVDTENTQIPKDIIETILSRPEVDVFDAGRLLDMVVYDGTNRNYIIFSTYLDEHPSGFSDTTFTDTLTARSVLNSRFFDLESQRIQLVDGRNITQEEFDEGKNVGLIPKPLAEINRIKVGDKIQFRFQDYQRRDHARAEMIGESYEIEVVGIFDLNTEGYFDASGVKLKDEVYYVYIPDLFMDELETMAVAFETEYPYHYSGLYSIDDASVSVASVYYPKMLLKSADDLESFKLYLEALLADLNLSIITANDAYESIAAPILIISVIADYILIIGFGVSVLTVTLITVLFLRDRTNELGIYSAIGKSKLNTVAQVLVEVFAIAFIATTLAVFTGQALSKTLTTAVVQKQLAMVDEAKLVKIDQSASSLVSVQEVAHNYKTEMNSHYFMSLYGLVLGSAVLSSIVPSVLILSVKPKKILL